MKYAKIILLHFENLLEHRSRSFVWFLVSAIGCLIYVLFWLAATQGKKEIIPSWSSFKIISYYLFLLIASVFLTSHIEEDVAKEDIREGLLTKYLLKPFSYYWIKFFEELPYRVLQGFYGVIVLLILYLFFGKIFVLTNDFLIIILSIIIMIFAYFLFFTYKIIIGLIAFWLIDIGGFLQLQEMFILVFAGYVIPLEFLPKWLENIANILPFSYMIYYPIISFEGKLVHSQLIWIILFQAIWLFILILIYNFLWKKGLQKYSAVGQ